MKLVIDNSEVLEMGGIPGYDVQELSFDEDVVDEDYGAVFDIDEWDDLLSTYREDS